MYVCVQAQQQIPDWLEEMSSGSVGIGGFTNSSGQARDSRRGNVCIIFYVRQQFLGIFFSEIDLI